MCVYCNLVSYLMFCFNVNVSLHIIRNLKPTLHRGLYYNFDIANVNLK